MPDFVSTEKANTETADSAALPTVERHPLRPFLPAGARVLMLGSFPPPRKRWSMDFFYPNYLNDMWRIFGLVFRGDKDAFVDADNKRFRQAELVTFLEEKGVALYDTAVSVRRLQGNASDKFLEVVEPTDIAALLRQIPRCRVVVTTGQKATDTLCDYFQISEPKLGDSTDFEFEGRPMRFFRMPSSSRAYPLKLERKAGIYGKMFAEAGLK